MSNIDNANTLINFIEKYAFETPENIAYICGEITITYICLLEKVNSFAGYLLEQGVVEGDIIGVCLNRSIDMIVSLLAIIKIRATYLPIDEKYPLKRIIYMLDHACVKYLVTYNALPLNLNMSEIKKIYFRDDYEMKSEFEEKHSDYLAYVIYTSGSTGVPKGVQIGNRSLINILRSVVEILNITNNDTILAITTISFDIAALELFVCLLVGAKCVIVSDFEKKDGILLNSIFTKHRISIMQATPTHFKLLVQTGWHGSENVRLLCGGESLDSTTAQTLLKRSQELWNMYGPTETTIWSTMTKILSSNTIAIGSPIANTVIYICTEDMQQVACNQVGELYIGGIGVSWGYLNDKEHTEDKFTESPFPEYKGVLFRTGDLVKKTSTGDVLFVGRRDTQVKHKGYRIELSEIDTLLSNIPGIQYITTILEENNSYTWLHCLVKTDQNIDHIKKKIMEVAKCDLPYYMWPDNVSFLHTLPLTDNGKIDHVLLKDALRRCEFLIKTTDEIDEDNCKSSDSVASQIVSKIYGKPVAEQDNLINLGFDSLKMAEIVSNLRLNGYNVDFGMFETCSTIYDMEKYIKNCYLEKKDDTITEYGIDLSEVNDMAIARRISLLQLDGNTVRFFPTTECQHCMIQHSLLYKNSKAYTQTVVHNISGSLDIDNCKKALSVLIGKCDLLNSIFLHGNGASYRTIINTFSCEMFIEFINFSGNDIQEILQKALNASYNLSQDPLFKLRIGQINENEYIFIWSYHHVLFDGYSIEKIIELFWQLYRYNCLNQEAIVTIETTDKYIHWIKQQTTSLEAKKFWLESTRPLITSGVNIEKKMRPTLKTIDAQNEFLWIVRENIVSDFMACLKDIHVLPHAGIKSVWAIVLHKIMKKNIIYFGNVLSGRSSCLPAHKELIGVMINIVPICTSFSNPLSYRELLVEMQKSHIMVMKYEFFPLDAIGWPTNKLYDALDYIVIYNHPSSLMPNLNKDILASLNLQISHEKVYDIINCKMSLTFSYDRQLQMQVSYNTDYYTEQEIQNIMQLFETTMQDINTDINKII